jgi:ubiquinol-cytochrome c reductase iron-sulfur subunit
VRVLRWLWRVVVAVVLVRRRRGPDSPDSPAADPRHRDARSRPSAELGVSAALIAAGAWGLAFAVLFVVDPDTQLLGLALGGAFALLAVAAILAAKRVVPQETIVEERPKLVDEAEEEQVEGAVREGGEGVSRRRLLGAAAGAAGAGLGAALVVPVSALGPNVAKRIDETPWHRGRRLVDERGRPVLADDVAPKQFITAFPEGADPRELGSPVVVVRVPPDELDLPTARASWAPEGILAYSKICTHAGCAIALYRAPLYEATSRPPALVCPCHYSTFDVRRGAAVTFGPAGRPLPQLPLAIAADRTLVAAGGFSGSIGPAWWSVRRGS